MKYKGFIAGKLENLWLEVLKPLKKKAGAVSEIHSEEPS